MDERIKKYLRGDRSIALVLYALSQTPSHFEELSGELCINHHVLRKILSQLAKYDLIERLGSYGISDEIFPILYEKCCRISPSDPLGALDSLEFYSITAKGQDYLALVKKIIFKGGGNRERK